MTQLSQGAMQVLKAIKEYEYSDYAQLEKILACVGILHNMGVKATMNHLRNLIKGGYVERKETEPQYRLTEKGKKEIK